MDDAHDASFRGSSGLVRLLAPPLLRVYGFLQHHKWWAGGARIVVSGTVAWVLTGRFADAAAGSEAATGINRGNIALGVIVGVLMLLPIDVPLIILARVREAIRDSLDCLEQVVSSAQFQWEPVNATHPPPADSPPGHDVVDPVLRTLIGAVELGGPSLHIFSWNLIYAWLHEEMPVFAQGVRAGADRDLIWRLARANGTKEFRTALENFKSDLVFILPDARSQCVKDLFKKRSRESGLTADQIRKACDTGLKCARAIAKARGKRATLILRTPAPVRSRVMLSSGAGHCFLQHYKDSGLGIADVVMLLRREKEPKAFESITAATRATQALLEPFRNV